MNAAELDRYIAAERAHNDAISAGQSEEEAQQAAREAVVAKRREQILRSVGIDP